MDKIKLCNHSLYQEDVNSILELDCDFYILKNKTIFISGSTGLIGTVLTDMLFFLSEKIKLNLTLVLISRKIDECIENHEYTTVIKLKSDITDNSIIDVCKNFHIDYIFHLASNTHPKQYSLFPIETITTNVLGTKNLLELSSKNHNCRFILASSVEVYGELEPTSKGAIETEFGYLDCNTPRACYNESKRLSETLCQAYKVQENVDVVIARLCRCYGPSLKKDDTKALSQFITNGISGNDIVLKSNGNQYFSYLYSSDAASALIFLMIKGVNGEAYNISDEKSNVHLKDLANIIAGMCDLKVIFDLPTDQERQGYSKATTAVISSEKINNLGWTAKIDINTGLDRTIKILKDIR